MKVFRTVEALRAWRRAISHKQKVGFVPTMGALHAGHLSLVKQAERSNDVLVASIFVNPLQFGPNEDFARYPRTWAQDRILLAKGGIDAVFLPTPVAMYKEGHVTTVVVKKLTDRLCGAPTSRGPQHFIGVATIVNKLFNVVQPTNAYFGMKDFQQLRVIEQMVDDLNIPVRIVRCATMREPDGLAMSSRNAYLSPSDRAQAPRVYLALQQGIKLLRSRSFMSPRAVCQHVASILAAHPPFRIDYVELVDPVTLQPLKQTQTPALLAAAVFLNKTRLIDNILISK